jgi:LysM repeat protein
MIKVILGGMAITSISLSANDNDTALAADTPLNVAQNDGSKITSYTVVAGDTVYGIAKRFGITPEALRSANHLSTDMLQIGQVLNIFSSVSMPTNYTVVAGETLYGVFRVVSVQQLLL